MACPARISKEINHVTQVSTDIGLLTIPPLLQQAPVAPRGVVFARGGGRGREGVREAYLCGHLWDGTEGEP